MQAARGAIFLSKSSPARFPNSRTASIVISKAVRGSNIWWRGRTFAATAPELVKSQRVSRRVSKQERRALLESFVDKYRASNTGKFPSASVAMKEVGGSFYVVRLILQEIKFSCKVSSEKDEVPSENAVKDHLQHFHAEKESQTFPQSEVASTSAVTTKAMPSPSLKKNKDLIIETMKNSNVDDTPFVQGCGATAKHIRATEEPQVYTRIRKVIVEESTAHVKSDQSSSSKPIMAEAESARRIELASTDPKPDTGMDQKSSYLRHTNDIFQDINRNSCRDQESNMSITSNGTPRPTSASAKTSHIAHTGSDGTHGYQLGNEGEELLRGSTNDRITLNGSQSSDGPIPKGGPELENFRRDDSKKLEREDPSDKRSTVWGNLKSLAEGLVNFWRKM